MIAVSISSLRAKIKYYFDLVSQSSEMIVVSRKTAENDAIVLLSLRDFNALQAQAKQTKKADQNQGQSIDEATFWDLIAQLDWRKGYNNQAIIRPLVNRLSAFPIEEIFAFQEILSTKLYTLDQKVYAENLGTYKYNGSKHFSGDSFLYARAAVIANGKKFYQNVLSDPTKMPKEYTFEALLAVAPQAYKEKTGEDWNYFTKNAYETFSNAEGWDGYGLLDRLLNL